MKRIVACLLFFVLAAMPVFAQQGTPRMAQQALLPDGAANCSSLGLVFAADTDTGIVRSAANTLGICAGGALRASVSSSGFAVGVTGSTYTFDIQAAGAAVQMFNFQLSSAGTNYIYGFIQNTGGQLALGVVNSVAGNGLIGSGLAYASVTGSWNSTAYQLITASLARVTIDTSGNVGIATTTGFGTSFAGGLSLGTATAPTTSPVDVVQLWAADWAGVAGAHALSVRTEGGQVHGLTNLGIIAALPAAESIAAAATITADACGGFKRISSAGAVTTNTTNTFTAPAAANAGCVMAVCNTGANNITLDVNANFKTAGGADVILTSDDCVIVASTGAAGVWYQISGLNAN